MGMFANAAVVSDKKPAKGKKKEEFVETKDLHLYAALCAVQKNVEAQISVIGSGIKGVMMSNFISEGIRKGCKPDSYKGAENGSTASLQFRCRSTTSGLSEEEVELLEEYNIPYSEAIARDETFIINPAYADLTVAENAAMLEKVEEALSALGLPADFIMKQEKDAKKIVTDETIEAVCKLTKKGKPDEASIAALMPVAGVLGIRATLAKGANPFKVVDDALGTPVELESAESAAA
jgi:hypothetical protein